MCNGLCWSSTPLKTSFGFCWFSPWRELEWSGELHVFKCGSCVNELPRLSCCAASQGPDSGSAFSNTFSELPCSCLEGRAVDGAAPPFPLRLSIFCKWAVLCLGMNLLWKGNAIVFQWRHYLKCTLDLPIRSWWWCLKLRKNKDITKIPEKEQRVAAIKRKFKSLKLDPIVFE